MLRPDRSDGSGRGNESQRGGMTGADTPTRETGRDTHGRARSAAVQRPRALEPADVAWLAAVPCAALTALAVLLLGPPLATLLPAADLSRFWPRQPLLPEPVEHARYGLALLGPPLL